MTPAESELELRKRIGPSIDTATARVSASRPCWRSMPSSAADGVPVDQNGDMLLFQWGTYAFTGSPSFQLDITRQYILPDNDEPYQLLLTLHYEPTEKTKSLGHGNQWCDSPDQLAEFREFIEASDAYRLLADSKPARVELEFSQGRFKMIRTTVFSRSGLPWPQAATFYLRPKTILKIF